MKVQRMDQEVPREGLEKVRGRPAASGGEGEGLGGVDIRGQTGQGNC